MKLKLILAAIFFNLSWEMAVTESKNATAALMNNAKQEERRLIWYFGERIVYNDYWYTDIDPEDVPYIKQQMEMKGDPDRLRSRDQCPNEGTRTYELENCPAPPNCENVERTIGKAKLCINRVPSPDKEFFYVIAMTCIPIWVRCDECICGRMRNGRCKFKSSISNRDDRISIDCDDSTTFEAIQFHDLKFNYFLPRDYPTQSPTRSVAPSHTSSPSHAPTISFKPTGHPTKSPTFGPTSSFVPTSSPSLSIIPTVSHSPTVTGKPTLTKVPTELPSASIAPTFGPSILPSAQPTISRIPSVAPSVAPSVPFWTFISEKEAIERLQAQDDEEKDVTTSSQGVIASSSANIDKTSFSVPFEVVYFVAGAAGLSILYMFVSLVKRRITQRRNL